MCLGLSITRLFFAAIEIPSSYINILNNFKTFFLYPPDTFKVGGVQTFSFVIISIENWNKNLEKYILLQR